ncbi:unnamed protein product [Dibothriocephalus latus]|uniref:Uncharacterized protein n=1 Tax=Dibothriocephalus latus TaxID=60516 RepID=A0A3P7L836_DIBLA|nr:unnamed protein product [Dibothriocephalus latus]
MPPALMSLDHADKVGKSAEKKEDVKVVRMTFPVALARHENRKAPSEIDLAIHFKHGNYARVYKPKLSPN